MVIRDLRVEEDDEPLPPRQAVPPPLFRQQQQGAGDGKPLAGAASGGSLRAGSGAAALLSGAGHSGRRLQGAAMWDDVAGEELAAIAANIARNAMPSSIGLELGSTSDSGPRYAARAIDDGNADPLGFGRLDPQNLTLVCVQVYVCGWVSGSVGGWVELSATSTRRTRKNAIPHP